MIWYIVYKGKAITGSFAENLDAAGIEYYVPMQKVEHLDGDRIVLEEQNVLRNLIFIHTDQDIREVCKSIDGLKTPYLDRANGNPATVTDTQMQQFMQIQRMSDMKAELLQDPYRRFAVGEKVRVRAGDFEGTEGYVFRMRGDRKLIIALGDMAVAITGIHHSLLETIENREIS